MAMILNQAVAQPSYPNFIQKNINYVNKLNEIVKEKKGRTAANSTTRNNQTCILNTYQAQLNDI